MPRTLLARNADVARHHGRRTARDPRRRPATSKATASSRWGRRRACRRQADEVIDLAGHVVIPGLVNTHHHMFQSLTRVVPAAQDGELFDWLTALFPIWAGLTPEMITVSTKTAMAELMLSGCTTAMDHLYLYPNGIRLDDEIEAADEIGMRFHASRGSDEPRGEQRRPAARQPGRGRGRGAARHAAPHRDLSRQIAARDAAHRGRAVLALHREPGPDARGGGARPQLWRLAAHPSRRERQGRRLSAARMFGCTPAQYAEKLDWVGHDVWHAHCVKLDDHGIEPVRPHRHRRRPLSRARTCGSPPASRRSAGCARPACRSASASTARPRTTPAACSRRRARRCCSPASASAPTP